MSEADGRTMFEEHAANLRQELRMEGARIKELEAENELMKGQRNAAQNMARHNYRCAVRAQLGFTDYPPLVDNEYDDLAARLQRVEKALAMCALPLEVLQVDNERGAMWMCTELSKSVHEAVLALRAALAPAPNTGQSGSEEAGE